MSENPGSVDALESVTSPGCFYRQLPIAGFRGNDKSRWPPLGVVIRTQAPGAPGRFLGPLLVDDLRNPNAVVGEDFLAAGFLNRMVLCVDTPGDHGPLVLPYLVGEQEILPIQAPEPVDEKAAAHGLEGRLQRSREIQIAVTLPFFDLHFKKLRNHGWLAPLAPRAGRFVVGA